MENKFREIPQSPPKGWRKAIPATVKLDAVIRFDGRCSECGERLGTLADTEFDHVPAIHLRQWDEEKQDTIPPVNDPEYLQPKHKEGCHSKKTSGRKGESKLSQRGGDVSEVAKIRRLTKKEEEFRQKILAKDDPNSKRDKPPKPKRTWPKRPFPSRKNIKNGDKS